MKPISIIKVICFTLCFINYGCSQWPLKVDAPDATTAEIINNMKAHIYAGTYLGKTQLKMSATDTLQTSINSGIDTLKLFTINENTFRLKPLADSNKINHDIFFASRNTDLKYLYFRGRLSNENLLTTFPITLNDPFQNSSTGPESAMLYFYLKDSIVYFENMSPNFGGGATFPYTNYYKLAHLKGF